MVKFTRKNTNGSIKSRHLLEIIHTNICGPLRTTFNGNKYFLTFIGDYSCFGYIFLMNEKSSALDKLMIFNNGVGNNVAQRLI